MEKQKNCINCSFYRKHYIKKATGFQETSSGHCVNPIRKSFIPDVCNHWEERKNQEEEQKQQLSKTLIRMAKQINEINQILKIDSD